MQTKYLTGGGGGLGGGIMRDPEISNAAKAEMEDLFLQQAKGVWIARGPHVDQTLTAGDDALVADTVIEAEFPACVVEVSFSAIVSVPQIAVQFWLRLYMDDGTWLGDHDSVKQTTTQAPVGGAQKIHDICEIQAGPHTFSVLMGCANSVCEIQEETGILTVKQL